MTAADQFATSDQLTAPDPFADAGVTSGVTADVTADVTDPAPRRPAPAHPPRSRRADLLVLLVCVLAAGYLTCRMWIDPNHRVILHNQGDQALFEWLLGYAAHTVTHGANPYWTTLLNAPVGANLAVNTSMVVVGALLAPVTLTLGAPVAFLTALTLNLVLTPYAWYLVLSRHLTRTRAAAVLGALFCGYAPGMVSHANAHLNFTGQFLVPFIVLCVLRLPRPRRVWRRGVALGLLVAAQYTIGAEMLFIVGSACAVFTAIWAGRHRRAARAATPHAGRSLAVAAGVVAVLLAYPLFMQFAGPQRYHGIGFDQGVHSEDLASYIAVPYLSLARLAGLWTKLAPNFTEETTFFGPVLLFLAVVCAVVLRRRPLVRAMSLTGLVFAVLALGPKLRVGGTETGVPMPFTALAGLPVVDSSLPARFALILIPIVGTLLALALDRVLDRTRPMPPRRQTAWLVAFVVALLPVVPVPLPAGQRAAVPRFFTDGTWRRFVHDGQTLVPVPPASDLLPDGQRWQTAAGMGFAIPAGFYLGPGPDGRSQIGPVPRPTAALLTSVALRGTDPVVTEARREQARVDLAYWHAAVVVLSDGGPGSRWTPHRALLLRVSTELFGPPQRVEDVWVWRVSGTSPAPGPRPGVNLGR